MYSVEPKIKIVGGIANIADAVGARLSRSELAAILSIFGQRTAKGRDYTDTSGLIKKALDLFAEIDEPTAENITTAFTNRPSGNAACAGAGPAGAEEEALAAAEALGVGAHVSGEALGAGARVAG